MPLRAVIAVLSIGAGSLLAQNLTPGYTPPPPPPLLPLSAPAIPLSEPPVLFDVPDVSVDVIRGYDPELEHRIFQLEEAMKQKVDRPDTKRAWSTPRISGRLFIDSVNFIDQNAESREKNGNWRNATGFRELRLGAAGSGYGSFDYKLEVGINANSGQIALFDNWIGVKNVPLLGYVRAGHYRVETGLNYTMGSTNITSTEYTTPANTFGLARKIGVSSEHLFAQDRVRLFFGVFQGVNADVDRRVNGDNQGQIVNVRLTAAPWFAQEGKYLLHLGGHWEYVATPSKSVSFNTSPATFGLGVSQTALQSGTLASDYSNRGGLEFMYQHGRYSVRSELFAGSFNGYGAAQGRHLYGTYVELGYFLTDDFRTYDLNTGLFSGVKTKRNFHLLKCRGQNVIDSLGAWQAFFQWGYTDMTDWRRDANSGGYQNDFVAGMNWFWTPQLRWIFEYVRSEQCVGTGFSHRSQDIFATSLRVHF